MVQYRGPASSSGLALHAQEYTFEKVKHDFIIFCKKINTIKNTKDFYGNLSAAIDFAKKTLQKGIDLNLKGSKTMSFIFQLSKF